MKRLALTVAGVPVAARVFNRRNFCAAMPIAALFAFNAGSVVLAQDTSVTFEGRWTGQGKNGPVEMIVAPGGAVTLTSAGKPVSVAPPIYSNGKLMLKTFGGSFETTIVPEGRSLKATTRALRTNQEWDVMLNKVAN